MNPLQSSNQFIECGYLNQITICLLCKIIVICTLI